MNIYKDLSFQGVLCYGIWVEKLRTNSCILLLVDTLGAHKKRLSLVIFRLAHHGKDDSSNQMHGLPDVYFTMLYQIIGLFASKYNLKFCTTRGIKDTLYLAFMGEL